MIPTPFPHRGNNPKTKCEPSCWVSQAQVSPAILRTKLEYIQRFALNSRHFLLRSTWITMFCQLLLPLSFSSFHHAAQRGRMETSEWCWPPCLVLSHLFPYGALSRAMDPNAVLSLTEMCAANRSPCLHPASGARSRRWRRNEACETEEEEGKLHLKFWESKGTNKKQKRCVKEDETGVEKPL